MVTVSGMVTFYRSKAWSRSVLEDRTLSSLPRTCGLLLRSCCDKAGVAARRGTVPPAAASSRPDLFLPFKPLEYPVTLEKSGNPISNLCNPYFKSVEICHFHRSSLFWQIAPVELCIIMSVSYWAQACSTASNKPLEPLLNTAYASCGVTVSVGLWLVMRLLTLVRADCGVLRERCRGRHDVFALVVDGGG
jgi:hypothetical protein